MPPDPPDPLMPVPTPLLASIPQTGLQSFDDISQSASRSPVRSNVLFMPRLGQIVTIRFLEVHQYVYQKWEDTLKRYSNHAEQVDGSRKVVASFVIDRGIVRLRRLFVQYLYSCS